MAAVLSREEMVYMAKLGEQSERYEDMANYMKEVAKMGDELNIEERNLLSVAYKNVVGSRRNAWRIVGSISQKHEQKNSGSKSEITEMVKKNIEKELRTTCNDLLDLIETVLLPRAHVAETKVFVLKMKGDYFRYLAEFSTDKERDTAAEKSLAAYKEATEIAKSFSCTDPMLLGLALNFSVFYYEIMNSPDQACKIAKTAFDEAVAGLDTLPEDSYKDSTLIMQLLRDNITLWTADNVEEAEGDAHVNTTVLPKAE